MCIGNFDVPSFYAEMCQKGDFLLGFPKLEYGSQSPKYGETFNFIRTLVPTEYIEKIHQSLLLIFMRPRSIMGVLGSNERLLKLYKMHRMTSQSQLKDLCSLERY